MTTTPEPPPLLSITAHDAGMDRLLRQSVTELRTRAAGTPLAPLLDDVLAGRRTLRDVARTREFDDVVAPAARHATEQWAALSDDEREALVQEGREALERAREDVARERLGGEDPRA